MNLDSDHEVRLDISGAGKDSGLRPRKKVLASKTESSQTENIDDPPSEILETPETASPPVTIETPLLSSPASKANDDDHENGHGDFNWKSRLCHHRYWKSRLCLMVGLSYIFWSMVILIPHATMNKLQDKVWNIEIWKWCWLGLPVFLGFIFSDMLINGLGMLENACLHGKMTDETIKVIGFLYFSMAENSRVFFWLLLTSATWWNLIGSRETKSIDATNSLRYILKGVDCAAYVAAVWIHGTIVMNFSYASFYNIRFSERIQENRFHQYVLKTLSKTRELSEAHSSGSGSCSGSNFIDVQTHQGAIRWLIETAPPTGFYTLPNTLDESKDLMNPDEQKNRIITTEREAKAVGDHIFENVAKPENNYIQEEDLLRFMKKEEVDKVLRSIEGKEENGKINEKPFHNWVVSMYTKSKFLEYSLSDVNEAMKRLLKFVNVLLLAVLIILWIILMDIATTEVLLFISSQFLLAVFTFGNFAKSTFEAMMFVILKHPFDVGDRCVIDGVQVVVEKVSISTSVFLKYDNEKIYYPNSILSTKSISNLNRSPEMKDTVEFDLDASTSVENISALKDKIKVYIESKPHFWRPKHSVRVKGVTNVNSNIKMIKMSLYVTHTLKFPDYEEKCDRRSNLVLELRNIFLVLGIEGYQILPSTSSN